MKKVQTAVNVVRHKTLRIIYFENSVLGRTLGLLGMNYGTPSDKVDTLTLIRMRNAKKV